MTPQDIIELCQGFAAAALSMSFAYSCYQIRVIRLETEKIEASY